MSLSIGVRDVRKVASLIEEGGFDSAEEAARAVIETCFELYESKAQWAVAGQLYYSPAEGGYIDHDDARAAKVILGPFSTLKQAENAGRQLAIGTPTNEQFMWWAVPVWHGSANDYYKQRKAQHDERRLKTPASGLVDESATGEEEGA